MEAELRPRYQRLIRSLSPGWESGHGAFKADQVVDTLFFFFLFSIGACDVLPQRTITSLFTCTHAPERRQLASVHNPPAAAERDRGGCDAREPAWTHHGTIASGCEALKQSTYFIMTM